MGKRLENKPLVEAIFELRWGREIRLGQIEDPNYQVLVGLLFEAFRNHGYGFYEQLESAAIPDQFSGHVVQHRFRVGKGQWPLIQLGKGIITVNDTEDYDWDTSFFRRCKEAVEALFEKYPGAISEMPFQAIILKYLDAYEFDYDKSDLFDFLEKKMNLSVRLPTALLDSANLAGNPGGFATNFTYDIPHLDASLKFKLARGTRTSDNTGLLIWETVVQSDKDKVPREKDAIAEWLDRAHRITSNWFFKLIQGDLEREFS